MRQIIIDIVPSQPRISAKMLEKIADISINVGNICLGSIVLPFVLDHGDWRFSFLGLMAAFFFWLAGLWTIHTLE